MTHHTQLSLVVLLLLILITGPALQSTGEAQPTALLLSLAKDSVAASGVFQTFQSVDLLRFEPNLSKEVFPFLSRQNLEVLLGDADNDGEFDDAPGNIDALTTKSFANRPSPYDLIFSFSAASTRFLEGTVLDGDLNQLLPGGKFHIFASEAVLSSITGTRTIDVDAATLSAAGELIFSFTDDEVTTNQILIQQNGNNNKLGDETILGWKPGTTQVRIVHTAQNVIAMVSKATGKSLTSIVDVVGLSVDPSNPGDLLFTTASSAKGLIGAVFTTAGGGSYAAINSVTLDGSNAWGLKESGVLDAITTYRGGKDPLCLELLGERILLPGPETPEIRTHGGVPRGTVQLYLTLATFPAPVPFDLPPPLNGVLNGYVTVGDPLMHQSVLTPALKVPIDGDGRGRVRLYPGSVAPGVSFVIQAVDLSSYEVSEPVVLDLAAK